MSRTCTNRCRTPCVDANLGVLSDCLRKQLKQRPRAGQTTDYELDASSVTDDLPAQVPVTSAEVEVFESWFGDLFNELFGLY